MMTDSRLTRNTPFRVRRLSNLIIGSYFTLAVTVDSTLLYNARNTVELLSY